MLYIFMGQNEEIKRTKSTNISRWLVTKCHMQLLLFPTSQLFQLLYCGKWVTLWLNEISKRQNRTLWTIKTHHVEQISQMKYILCHHKQKMIADEIEMWNACQQDHFTNLNYLTKKVATTFFSESFFSS